MKILVAHQFFWPDTPPYASLLRTIGDYWSREGHDVTVFCSQPSYKQNALNRRMPPSQKLGKLQVVRSLTINDHRGSFPIKLINSLLFLTGLGEHILKHRDYDLVMISTMPPVMAGSIASLAARFIGAKFIYHCMDIYPDIAVHCGLLKNGVLSSIAERIDRNTCGRADAVVVLSGDMSSTYQNRGKSQSPLRLSVINNFNLPDYEKKADPDAIEDLVSQYRKDPEKFRILFAGNLGRFQGLSDIIEAASFTAKDKKIEWMFAGEGRQKSTLMAEVEKRNLSNVHFAPHLPVSAIRELLSEADLGLVSLSQGLYKFAFPSKFSSYLELGCPVLAVVEEHSNIARIIQEEEVGIVCSQGNSEKLAQLVINASKQPILVNRMSERAKELATKNFTAHEILPKWAQLLKSLSE